MLNSRLAHEIINGASPSSAIEIQSEDGRSLRINPTATPIDFTVPGFIPILLQDTNHRCWAATAAILLSWKRNTRFTARAAAELAGRDNDGRRFLDLYDQDQNLSEFSQHRFLSNLGLTREPPASLDWQGFLQLMRTYGPLWIQTDRTPEPETTHFVVAYGLRHNSHSTEIRIIDPARGRLVQEFTSFVAEYERIAFEAIDHSLPFLIQLAHWPDNAG